MDEQKAIELCVKHQDPIGFEFLVEQYRREAYRHAAVLLGNHEDALDACQECFAKAYRAIPKLAKLDAFYPWFYRILRNHCLNIIYKRKLTSDVTGHERDENGHSPDVLIEQDDDCKEVWCILEKLQPQFREILVMKYIENRSYQDLSNALNIPRGTVMSRLYLARKAFRNEYNANHKPGESK